MIKQLRPMITPGLCFALILMAGCGPNFDQVTIKNQSSTTVYIKEIENIAMDSTLTSIAPQQEWAANLSSQPFPKQVTIHWYVMGKTNHLPAIKQSTVQFDQNARSKPQFKLEFTSSRTWKPITKE